MLQANTSRNKVNTQSLRRVVVVDGCRTPFCRSGTVFNDLNAYDLGVAAVSGLIGRSLLPQDRVDLLVLGTVVADPETTNLGREVVIGSGLTHSCPAYTVSVACVSSLQSFLNCVQVIQTGMADVAMAIQPTSNKVVLLQMDGNLTEKEFKQGFKMTLKACQKIGKLQQKALKEKYKVEGEK